MGNFTDDFDGLAEADWIIEAVSERPDSKRGLMPGSSPCVLQVITWPLVVLSPARNPSELKIPYRRVISPAWPAATHCTSGFLRQVGVDHDYVRLADVGIRGNCWNPRR